MINLSLDFYEGEVCTLLGHNGAGKTTTTFILVGMKVDMKVLNGLKYILYFEGMLEPTSGRVTIQGMDNQIQIEEVRHYLGFCPQYGMMNNFFIFQIFLCVLILDILYDELSVEEHLELIAKVSS